MIGPPTDGARATGEPAPPVIERLAVVGTGLIGGSMALAARAHGAARTIVVTDHDAAVRGLATAMGLADVVAPDICSAVRGADLVVLAVPVRELLVTAHQALECMDVHAVLTDVGSVKYRLTVSLEVPAGITFVGGHPMACLLYTSPSPRD